MSYNTRRSYSYRTDVLQANDGNNRKPVLMKGDGGLGVSAEDYLADTLLPQSITASRTLGERTEDKCTYCQKPVGQETKMRMDENQIYCHASCFKCEVCNTSLSHLKAGDSMWIYRRIVHCDSCYSLTRDQWRH